MPPRAHAHRALHRALHRATERDALRELVRDVVGDELSVELRALDLFDVDPDFLAGQMRESSSRSWSTSVPFFPITTPGRPV